MSNNIIKFYLLTTTLKERIRQGSIYWNVEAKRRESIAEHVYGTCMLAIAIDSEYNCNIDRKKVIEMLVIHELEEIIIGDITPFDNITPKQKLELGRKAVMDILSNLKKKDEYLDLTEEFNMQKTEEAKFAYLCDKLEFDIQMKLYTDKNLIHIDKNSNNPLYKSPIIQKMLEQGIDNPAKIFYEYDVNKYNDYPIFKNILDTAYSQNLNELLDKYLKNSNY